MTTEWKKHSKQNVLPQAYLKHAFKVQYLGYSPQSLLHHFVKGKRRFSSITSLLSSFLFLPQLRDGFWPLSQETPCPGHLWLQSLECAVVGCFLCDEGAGRDMKHFTPCSSTGTYTIKMLNMKLVEPVSLGQHLVARKGLTLQIRKKKRLEE